MIEAVLSDWVAQRIHALYPTIDLCEAALQVQPTQNEKFGDYQCNAAMAFAKKLSTKPRTIAEAIVNTSELPQGVKKLDIAGPGFINFHLSNEWLADLLLTKADNDRLGVAKIGSGKTIVIDYSSPNVAKPMHIGHIRSTVIGNALDRLYRFLGYRVLSDNHLGDWGTQFGLMIMGYKHLVDKAALEASPIEELERIYRESYNRSQESAEWLDAARSELVKLQKGDEVNNKLWQMFIDLSKKEFSRTYARLDIDFDLERGESYYNDKLDGVIALLEKKGLSEESEGALVVKLDEDHLPLCIVRKSDGGYNYATTDIATVLNRCDEFKPDEIIYVTDERQQLHFSQFFAICRKLGVTAELKHVWFGLMRLPHATFSTRQGNVIKLEALLDEAEKRAMEILNQGSSMLSPEQKADVAAAVGIGAVKYADLSQNPQSLVTFTWDKAMSLEGNSAPYLQYAYARIASVQDKYTERYPDVSLNDYPILIQEPVERRLALHLLRFGTTIEAAAKNYRPNFLADYLYELAQLYSSFYQNVPFLKAEDGIRESRIRLCALVARTLQTGLHLLGIRTPERV